MENLEHDKEDPEFKAHSLKGKMKNNSMRKMDFERSCEKWILKGAARI
jgi:hypothetical protein